MMSRNLTPLTPGKTSTAMKADDNISERLNSGNTIRTQTIATHPSKMSV